MITCIALRLGKGKITFCNYNEKYCYSELPPDKNNNNNKKKRAIKIKMQKTYA